MTKSVETWIAIVDRLPDTQRKLYYIQMYRYGLIPLATVLSILIPPGVEGPEDPGGFATLPDI